MNSLAQWQNIAKKECGFEKIYIEITIMRLCSALESIKRTCARSYKSSSKTITRIQSKGVSRQTQRRKHKFQTGNKTVRRISTIKPKHTHNTPSTLESGRKEKDAGAHPYKITNN